MSDWNLEFRKWKPRQPSPELRARIFATQPSVPSTIAFDLRDLTRWIVPAVGCFMLAMGSLSDRWHVRTSMDADSAQFVLPSLHEESAGQFPPSSTEHSVMNNIPTKTLEWSIGPRTATTSMGTILIAYTNKLIRQ